MDIKDMRLQILKDTFSVCKVKRVDDINMNSDFLFIGKTDEEISVVCKSNHTPSNYTDMEEDWKCIKIIGTLDFSLIGILSKITTILAENKIGIFVVSTYNTDYILVKENNIEKAKTALENNHYIFV